MPADYEAKTIFGHWFDPEDDLETLKQKREEKSRMEPRYDPKTGKRLPDVEVVEGGGMFYRIGDEWAENLDDLIELLHQRLKPTDIKLWTHESRFGEVLALVVGLDSDGMTSSGILTAEKELISAKEFLEELLGMGLSQPRSYAVLQAHC